MIPQFYHGCFLQSTHNTWREITYRFSKTLENTYEGVQSSEVADLQPATLLKINSFIDIKQGFQSRIHKNLPHSFNLFISVDRGSYSNNWITQLNPFKWIVYFTRNKITTK